MAIAVAEKRINWQTPSSIDNSETSVEDYRAMVSKAENSGYMPYETHRRKLNEWFNSGQLPKNIHYRKSCDVLYLFT